mmetsp:Transcript_82105/g.158634  ORF Transcript_82105/g.158634 Transcript_82105/m.158634 type:complete len:231 (-) Transcript_82105:221-913(-)
MGQAQAAVEPIPATCAASMESCSIALARHVLNAKSPFGETVVANCSLIRASKDGDVSGIEQAMAAGADIDTQLPILMHMPSKYGPECEQPVTDDDDDTSLQDECSDHDAVEVKARSLTPLMFACLGGHVEAVKLLLSFGASLDLHDPDGMQALHFAAEAESAGCFRALLEAGANPLVKDNFERDALQCVPLLLIARSSAKWEWLKLFKEASGMSELDRDTNSLDGVKEVG